jgi:MFS family permease
MAESLHVTGTGDYTARTFDSRTHDRVRWPAIIAGLFGTLSMMAVLAVLGAAIGLSAFDRHSDAGNFGIGAGIWGAVSALLSFAFGGWLAARTSDRHGRDHGVLQSAMVWMVSVALLTYLLGSGLGALTTSAAQGGAANPDLTSRISGDSATAGTTGDVSTNFNRADAERAAERGAQGAWGALIAMLLGLGASLAGGYLGSRRDHDGDDRRSHPAATARPVVSH